MLLIFPGYSLDKRTEWYFFPCQSGLQLSSSKSSRAGGQTQAIQRCCKGRLKTIHDIKHARTSHWHLGGLLNSDAVIWMIRSHQDKQLVPTGFKPFLMINLQLHMHVPKVCMHYKEKRG